MPDLYLHHKSLLVELLLVSLSFTGTLLAARGVKTVTAELETGPLAGGEGEVTAVMGIFSPGTQGCCFSPALSEEVRL